MKLETEELKWAFNAIINGKWAISKSEIAHLFLI